MTRVLVLFLDGVGLGHPGPDQNPFSVASMPSLSRLLDGRRLVHGTAPFQGDQATLHAVDPTLGVEGTPQSATGQAVLLTGRNVPRLIGMHYGPKPNPPIAEIIRTENLFLQVVRRGGKAALLNAYPPQYFKSIESGLRLLSAIPLAVTSAGIELFTAEDLQQGRALSVDFTGEGWAARPEFPPAPLYSPLDAGILLGELSRTYDLSWFDYWPSDYAGHRGSMQDAVTLLEQFDQVLEGLLQSWQNASDLLVITSDHGNLENISKRRHTKNQIPLLTIGSPELRRRFHQKIEDMTSIAPAILSLIFDGRHPPGLQAAKHTGS